jgi:hypothetical protein
MISYSELADKVDNVIDYSNYIEKNLDKTFLL